jgi:hypothetical protein
MSGLVATKAEVYREHALSCPKLPPGKGSGTDLGKAQIQLE